MEERRRKLDASGRLFYRRRHRNVARKAGNIADFCTRWGGSYEHMLVLDADSLMTGETILMLARLMATGDCFVHPNPDETYGLAPLEALATGTRVVAARGGGLRDQLKAILAEALLR